MGETSKDRDNRSKVARVEWQDAGADAARKLGYGAVHSRLWGLSPMDSGGHGRQVRRRGAWSFGSSMQAIKDGGEARGPCITRRPKKRRSLCLRPSARWPEHLATALRLEAVSLLWCQLSGPRGEPEREQREALWRGWRGALFAVRE